MKRAWEKTIPISCLLGWGDNYGRTVVYCTEEGEMTRCQSYESPTCLKDAEAILRSLADADWRDAFVRRDAVDLARTVADRGITDLCRRLLKSYGEWCAGRGDGAGVMAMAESYARAGELMADLLELHTDYSLYESYLRLNEVEKIRNPVFGKVLLENAACDYCHSHHYELARHWYEPEMRELGGIICRRVRSNVRKPMENRVLAAKAWREGLLQIPLGELRPRAARDASRFRLAVQGLAEAFAR